MLEQRALFLLEILFSDVLIFLFLKGGDTCLFFCRKTILVLYIFYFQKDLQTIMAAGLYYIQAPLQWVMLSSSPTETFSTLMASSSTSLSSSSQPVTIQTTNNDMIEKGGTPILKPYSETGKIFFYILWKLVMPPIFEKVDGAYCFWSVHACVRVSHFLYLL